MTHGTPPDTTLYAIGDIHARVDLLAALQERIAQDARQRETRRKVVVYLGDYGSRGEDSPGVVDLLQGWLPEGFQRVALKGNHEDMLLRFIDGDLAAGRHWFEHGGLDTLAHYGVAIHDRRARDDRSLALLRERFAAALPTTTLEFFRSLPVRYTAGNYCFVHGGVRPGVPLAQQTDHDCMWIREPFLDSDADHGAIIVHGHSINAQPVVRPNRIGIDTGAYRSGVLTCLALDGGGHAFLQT